MTLRQEQQSIAEQIIAAHGGTFLFNFGECAKIMRCGINHVGCALHEAGITVKQQGTAKLVTAWQLAEYITKERVAAIR